jgi:hypothetical protein
VGGTLYAPRWISFGAPVVRGVGKGIADTAQYAQLWELSERETGLTLESALATPDESWQAFEAARTV